MKRTLVIATCASPVAFTLGNLYVACLLSLEGMPIQNLSAAVFGLPHYIASGGGMSGKAAAICVGVLAVCAVWLMVARWLLGAGTHRDGEEHGSARWATKREVRAFADRDDPDNNILLTKGCSMALSKSKFDIRTDRNKNILVVGGSGSGKTRYYVKPNLMQMNASFFITDPKGTLLGDVGHMLRDGGYQILAFDTISFARSSHYNPLAYIKTEADILTFVDCLIKNTSSEEGKAADPFWENAERLLYSSLVAYLLNHCPKADQNIPGLLTLLSLAEAKEEDESFMSPLDILFKELETGMRLAKEGEIPEMDPESRAFRDEASGYGWIKQQEPVKESEDFALSNYKAFKTAAGKTLKSIIISCNVRLKPLSIREVSELLSYDEMKLDRLGDPGQKMAIFASMSDTNSTFDCLFAILMWQTLNVLCDTALERFSGKLPTPVHMVFDEFANIGTVPDFEKMIAVIRSRNISCSIILQSLSQLKSHYDDDAQTITDCCDTMLFLGGKSSETNKEISEAIGKQTLATTSINDSRGSNSSTTKNYNKQERDLLQTAEVGRLARDEAIVLISGAFPIKDKKYPLEAHPRYLLVDPGHKGARYKAPFSLVDDKPGQEARRI